ncbi:uncharacterized protein LAJ45_01460 [Morchella importuna]|uniref:uncharacterized protein n=1 Tax=Morchella importuna TaxID=1174673 RepID=UPI001E8D8355|nr:uncharacterized protein LAJ45_01460 [Morchella importuna]KAH8154928.1 hypothetical protein LAJ45_01460 [Morchella importuna]
MHKCGGRQRRARVEEVSEVHAHCEPRVHDEPVVVHAIGAEAGNGGEGDETADGLEGAGNEVLREAAAGGVAAEDYAVLAVGGGGAGVGDVVKVADVRDCGGDVEGEEPGVMGSTVAAEGEAVGWVAVGGEEGEKIYVAGSTTKPWCYIKEISGGLSSPDPEPVLAGRATKISSIPSGDGINILSTPSGSGFAEIVGPTSQVGHTAAARLAGANQRRTGHNHPMGLNVGFGGHFGALVAVRAATVICCEAELSDGQIRDLRVGPVG